MSSLTVSEAFCYICRGVLIEPVTLPCFHVFCFTCFEQSMQETSYSCPLCRKRISNWVRSVKKTNKLINMTLWKQIKEQFKEQVRLKLNGEDDGLDIHMQREYPRFEATSKPGEVAQEFSKLLNDFRNENERLRQAEELASKELIVKLKEEEEKKLQLIQRDNILRILEDKKLAMKIQEEINKEIPSTSRPNSAKKTSKKMTKSNEKNIKKPQKGLMDEFLKGFFDSDKAKENKTVVPPEEMDGSGDGGKGTDDRSTSTDSIDSITLETNHFKPIKKVKRTPPKCYPEGDCHEISLTKVTPLKLTFNSNTEASSSGRSIIEGINIHSSHSAFVDTNMSASGDNYESPSKRLRISSEESDAGVLKDITLGENNDSCSMSMSQTEDSTGKRTSSSVKKSDQENFMSPCKIAKLTRVIEENEDEENEEFETQDYLNPDPRIEDKIIEEQRRIEKIILQEKQDRELALKLSREWESELRAKPQTRSMMAASVKRKKNNENKKSQQTLFESIASRTRNQKK